MSYILPFTLLLKNLAWWPVIIALVSLSALVCLKSNCATSTGKPLNNTRVTFTHICLNLSGLKYQPAVSPPRLHQGRVTQRTSSTTSSSKSKHAECMNKIALSLVNFNSCLVAHLHFPAWLVFTVENRLPVRTLLVPVKHSYISVCFSCLCQSFGMWWISLNTFFLGGRS